MESWLFLLLILAVGLIAKNTSLIIATAAVLALKAVPQASKLFPMIQSKGINWGVTIITVAILIPIATEQIGFKELLSAFKSPVGWVAIICGVGVSLLSSRGVGLLAGSPEVTVALVFGTILGVVLLKGVAAGPVIAAGMTYCIMELFSFAMK
ncbi:DUF441 domain-containing protein [Isobaculum melis]|uniref:UPF0756 membrane protein SAMN04488559_10397 n=1 Tax=Isobaculum melis TaxID=142588 RepID=A0A1H9R6Z6_9LACT|nr:DUF441 domain-containing protein [Isobaculum melis]SER68470.1 Uncharacterized membrane protein, DUF441 family [Isobaculum melis]